VNVQVIADPAGRLIWTSAALPGAAHDLTAARTHGIIHALTSANAMTFADKAHQGAHGSIHTVQTPPAPAETLPLDAEATRLTTRLTGRRPSPAPTPASGHAANAPTPPSNPEDPHQTAPLPTPRHRDRASHPRPAPRRGQPLRRMKWLSNPNETEFGTINSWSVATFPFRCEIIIWCGSSHFSPPLN
jgi:hypothetical protein